MHKALAAHLGHLGHHLTATDLAITVLAGVFLAGIAVAIFSSGESRGEREARRRLRDAEDRAFGRR